MSILERLKESREAEKLAKTWISLCQKSDILADILVTLIFTRKDIRLNEAGIDYKAIFENLSLLGYTEQDIGKAISEIHNKGFIEPFQWRNRRVYDFAYKKGLELQTNYLDVLTSSQFLREKIREIQSKGDIFLTKKIKDGKDEKTASTIRLLYHIPLPEIGAQLEAGTVATFHLKAICGGNWLDILSNLVKHGVVNIRLNFLSSNPAFEYFIPEYARDLALSHISYSNIVLKKQFETLIPAPFLSEDFHIFQKHKEVLQKHGLCYRKWTTPKVALLDEYVPTPFLYDIFIKEAVEIPELVIKSYPRDELWTYYLISKALLNAKQSIFICSPYVDHTTLTFFIRIIPKEIETKLLTSRTGGKEKERRFLKVLQEFWKNGQRIEVVKVLREEQKVPLHDRYLIQDSKIVVDLPGDLKRGFSGQTKDENIKWIPFEDKVALYNNRFAKYWFLSFEETDFDRDQTPFFVTKFSYTKPDSVALTRIEMMKSKMRKEERLVSLKQYLETC